MRLSVLKAVVLSCFSYVIFCLFFNASVVKKKINLVTSKEKILDGYRYCLMLKVSVSVCEKRDIVPSLHVSLYLLSKKKTA